MPPGHAPGNRSPAAHDATRVSAAVVLGALGHGHGGLTAGQPWCPVPCLLAGRVEGRWACRAWRLLSVPGCLSRLRVRYRRRRAPGGDLRRRPLALGGGLPWRIEAEAALGICAACA